MFREDKTTQMAARFLRLSGNRRMPYIKLIKLLYLADRKMLTTRGKPITYDRWVSMNKGPVLSSTLNIIRSLIPSEYWTQHFRTSYHDVILCDDPGADNLSRAEDRIITEIFEEFGHLDRWELVRRVHELPEWKDPNGTSVEIPYEEVMRKEGFTEEEIEATMDNIGAGDALTRVLAMV
jgi:uncharacterized phage-associated protein